MYWTLVIPNKSNRNLVAIDCTVSTKEESVNPFLNLVVHFGDVFTTMTVCICLFL